MITKQQIICFGPGDWWGMNPSCATHIMRKLAQHNTVVYINPVSSDVLGITSTRGLLSRCFRKLKSMTKFVKRVDHSLFVVSLQFIPLQGIALIDKVNNLFVRLQIKILFYILKINRPILWIGNIRASDFIDHFKWKVIVYHMSDLFQDCAYTKNREKLLIREKIVTQRSNLIICVSRLLYEIKKEQHRNVHYLPHGVDYDLFAAASCKASKYRNLKGNNRKTAGYYGTLTEQNDIELLEYCAEMNPDVTFVFVGKVTSGDYRKLFSLPNVIYWGQLPYEKIPELCSSFDVCLLPWKMSDWIKSCNPLKLFEYMSSGKPIVSVPIDEVAKYSHYISIAADKFEFSRQIKFELDHDTPQRCEARKAIGKTNAWDMITNKISELIEATIR